MLRLLNSLSSCSDVDVLHQGDPVVQRCVSLHPMAYNDFLYDSLAYHRESIVGWRPCFP